MSDNPFEIPAILDRRGEKPPVKTREIGTEAKHRREAHRIAMNCRRLLDKHQRRRAREKRTKRRQAGGTS